ncbi:MAG: universal stress protein [Pseudomonadota bacterium]
MSFKNVFVHLSSLDASQRLISAAINTGLRFDAHVTGLYQVPDIDLSKFLTPDLGLTRIDQRLSEVHDERLAIRELFREAGKKASVSVEWIDSESHFASNLPRQARYADLIIVGQDTMDAARRGAPNLESFVLASGRPVLAIPTIGIAGELGSHALVAWDESRESARAVHDAVPFLKTARAVSVINVTDSSKKAAESTATATTLCHHLARHGIQAEARHSVDSELSVAECLLSRSTELGANLLIMGAYGHSRMRELVLGGATRAILTEMTLPVLFSH